MKYDINRKVGEEFSKTYQQWIQNGNLDRYMSGTKGLDIGFAGYIDNVVPALETAIGIDINYPGYNGIILPFETESIDYILASHILEHIQNTNLVQTLQEWHRVLKFGSYMTILVPHKFLYEKKHENKLGLIPGSHWNGGHNRFYTPASLMQEIESALVPNSYRIELLKDCDEGFDYSIGPERHSGGRYEILCVVKKIKKPNWDLFKGISDTHTTNTIIDHNGNKRIFTKQG